MRFTAQDLRELGDAVAELDELPRWAVQGELLSTHDQQPASVPIRWDDDHGHYVLLRPGTAAD